LLFGPSCYYCTPYTYYQKKKNEAPKFWGPWYAALSAPPQNRACKLQPLIHEILEVV
jgi:hypothetical protein